MIQLKLSVVIPARNEGSSISRTVQTLTATLRAEEIPHEIVVVDDHSRDDTAAVVARLAEQDPAVRCVENSGRPGFGYAVRAGLDAFTGDAVAIVMGDLSDSPHDVVAYHRLLEQGYDCAFGTRF